MGLPEKLTAALLRDPKDHIDTRILHSGSKAGFQRHHGLQDFHVVWCLGLELLGFWLLVKVREYFVDILNVYVIAEWAEGARNCLECGLLPCLAV